MRSRSNGGIIGAYQLPTQNYANGVFFIHDAAIYNTGNNPIWPLGTGYITSATGGTISIAADNSNYKLHTFTANGTFTVTTGSAYIDILLVGAGGCSGVSRPNSTSYWLYQGAGGGGCVVLAQQVFVTGGDIFTVEVGQPTTTAAYTTAGTNGKPSIATSNRGHSFLAPGGGGGGSINLTTFISAAAGGSGGGQGGYTVSGAAPVGGYTTGGSAGSTPSNSPGTITVRQNAGGGVPLTGTSTAFVAGGGGGATEPGFPPDYSFDTTKRSWGGNGWQWSRTGYYYGAGGAAAGAGIGNQSQSGLYGNGYRYTVYNQTVGGPGNASGFGVGGPGYYIPSTTSIHYGNSGYSGTVIFCYRYQ